MGFYNKFSSTDGSAGCTAFLGSFEPVLAAGFGWGGAGFGYSPYFLLRGGGLVSPKSRLSTSFSKLDLLRFAEKSCFNFIRTS